MRHACAHSTASGDARKSQWQAALFTDVNMIQRAGVSYFSLFLKKKNLSVMLVPLITCAGSRKKIVHSKVNHPNLYSLVQTWWQCLPRHLISPVHAECVAHSINQASLKAAGSVTGDQINGRRGKKSHSWHSHSASLVLMHCGNILTIQFQDLDPHGLHSPTASLPAIMP